MVAALMADALDQVTDRGCRQAALMQFVGRVGAEEAEALRSALAEVGKYPDCRSGLPQPASTCARHASTSVERLAP